MSAALPATQPAAFFYAAQHTYALFIVAVLVLGAAYLVARLIAWWQRRPKRNPYLAPWPDAGASLFPLAEDAETYAEGEL